MSEQPLNAERPKDEAVLAPHDDTSKVKGGVKQEQKEESKKETKEVTKTDAKPPLKRELSVSEESRKRSHSSGPHKKTKTASPTPQPLAVKINRPVEEIIDGSDLRKFLNKNVTPYLLKALGELTERWDKGELRDAHTPEVLREFSRIIQQYADKSKDV